MSKPLRLSHSAISCFSSCGRKYEYRYLKRLRSKTTTGALLFGSALDQALNLLLEKKDVNEAIKAFKKHWSFGFINNKGTYLPDTTLVLYSKTDFDVDLLTPEDITKFNEKQYEWNVYLSKSVGEVVSILQAKKAESGFDSLSHEEKQTLNLANWLSLQRKGLIMIESYNEKVMPQIKEVLAVQKSIELQNDEGDKVIGYIDFIVELNDGRRVVMDNKSTSVEYERDSASKSQQLILYYSTVKDEYKLDSAGFVTMSKHIIKNKTKICSVCGYNGSAGRHKTCPAEPNGTRCGGEWTETVDPEAKIDIIINTITPEAENLVLEVFDSANHSIKQGVFVPNLQACDEYNGCEYKDLCWSGSMDGIEEVERRE